MDIDKLAGDYYCKKYDLKIDGGFKDDIIEDFKAGYKAHEEKTKYLVEALESICGNRCAEQNPCEAKEALKTYRGEG